MDSRPWQGLDVPRSVERIPSMLSREEKQYLRWLTAETFEGWGAVVDLGPWLGSSTASLARGLEDQGHGARVQSYDLFRWDRTYMEAMSPQDLADGADFLPLFKEHLEPWSDRVTPCQGDLMKATWQGGPIEILFVDAAKSWDLLNAILRVFGPALEVGGSRVVLQDHRHFHTSFLPLVFDGHPELWEEREAVEVGTTVTYSPRSEFQIDAKYAESDFPFPRIEAIFERRIARETPRSRYYLRLALLYQALRRGAFPVVERLRKKLFGEDSSASSGDPRRQLAKAWERLGEGHLAAAQEIAERVVEEGRDQAQALLLLGQVAQTSGKRVLAKQLVDQALFLMFDHPPRVPGWDEFKAGELDEARELARSSIRHFGETAEAYFLLGRVAQEYKRFDDAERAYTRAIEIDPRHHASHHFRARLELAHGFAAFERGDLVEAERLRAGFVAKTGKTCESLFLTGRLAQVQGRLEEAEEAFSKALEIKSDHTFSQRFLAQVKAARQASAAEP